MIDYNAILGRETIYENIIKELNNFEINKNNISQKRGFYIYGESGIGKSYFIEDLLKNNNYNIIQSFGWFGLFNWCNIIRYCWLCWYVGFS